MGDKMRDRQNRGRSRRRAGRRGKRVPVKAGLLLAVLLLAGAGMVCIGTRFGRQAGEGTLAERTVAVAATNTETAVDDAAITESDGENGDVFATGIITEGEKSESERDDIPMLGGATLTMLASRTEGQMMSFLLETAAGSLIVVDGGRWEDGDYLMENIRARGGRISAWFLTHAHTDHVGALLKLLTDEYEGTDTGITIDHIYYNFADLDWYMVHELGDIGTAGSILSYLDEIPAEKRQTVEKGDVITIDDVTVTVMNDRYEPDAEHVGERDGNDASIAYRMVVNDVSILFLGDLQKLGGEWLLAETNGDLKSDLVQMAHHGQNGVEEDVYQAIAPSVCLWPCPQWLWDNEGGAYRTPETKEWMQKLQVQKHYCTKDGDQTIR